MIRILCISVVLCYATFLSGQDYDSFLGAKHSDNIIVTTSSDLNKPGWGEAQATGDKTIGAGLEGSLMEKSRFLGQACLGFNLHDVQKLEEIGMEAWIDFQCDVEKTNYLATLDDVYAEVYELYVAAEGDPDGFTCRPVWSRTNYAWWQMIMTGEDLLRQRVAFALSEILVVSKSNSTLTNYGYGLASFYDIFIDHGLGNFYDILESVTLHPVMGEYLSHRNNPKSNPELRIFADENYAREIMQLFSIGLYELNQDGTHILDAQGNSIPTYTNEHITEMARVFTGLGAGGVSKCSDGFVADFGLRLSKTDLTVPMVMYDDYHEQGEKILMKSFGIPEGQTGMEDVKDAVNFLFNHQNTAPFISEKLIKLLIKSNPSRAYVGRVSSAFNDNGSGVRGDMKAVIKAILLDEEARDCSYQEDPMNGKLKEPIIRYAQFAKMINKIVPDGRYWERGEEILNLTGQHPLNAPSVFNFFQPQFAPKGPVSDNGLIAPEFQILNTVTGLNYYNMVDLWTDRQRLFYNYEPVDYYDRSVFIDIYDIMNNAREPEVLINKLDVILTHGQLSDRSRNLIRSVLEEYYETGVNEMRSRTLLALFFFMTTPDYLIQK